MKPQDGFPRELLNQPTQARVAYFADYTMAHPRLVEAAVKLMHSIEQPAGASLIFIFGPTGVGKSTFLLRRVSQKITEAALPEMETDKGYIPIAGIEAISGTRLVRLFLVNFNGRSLCSSHPPLAVFGGVTVRPLTGTWGVDIQAPITQ